LSLSFEASPANTMRRCQSCGAMRQTQYVAFYRNIGMLFARRTITVQGDMCKSCVHRFFWEFTAKNILLGPWGVISMIVTPIYLIQNTGSYLVALYKLRDAPE
jgi:hypothetical protein